MAPRVGSRRRVGQSAGRASSGVTSSPMARPAQPSAQDPEGDAGVGQSTRQPHEETSQLLVLARGQAIRGGSVMHGVPGRLSEGDQRAERGTLTGAGEQIGATPPGPSAALHPGRSTSAQKSQALTRSVACSERVESRVPDGASYRSGRCHAHRAITWTTQCSTGQRRRQRAWQRSAGHMPDQTRRRGERQEGSRPSRAAGAAPCGPRRGRRRARQGRGQRGGEGKARSEGPRAREALHVLRRPRSEPERGQGGRRRRRRAVAAGLLSAPCCG